MATMIITSRQDARAQGLKHYYTGKPCIHGHVEMRLVSSGSCLECCRKKRHSEANREYHRQYRKTEKWKKWSAQHEAKPERAKQHAEARAKWVENNPELTKASKAKYRQSGREYALSLKDVPCAECGQRFPVICMDFDHRPGEVKHPRLTHKENGYIRAPISMTAFATQNIQAFMEEVKKCDVVCSNCHRIRTDRRRRHDANPQ